MDTAEGAGRMKTERFELVEVNGYMPKTLESGKLYHSSRCSVAIHICPCGGCGMETVTPIGADGWDLTAGANGPTLSPSIGNFQFPCKSHYFIRDGGVVWA